MKLRRRSIKMAPSEIPDAVKGGWWIRKIREQQERNKGVDDRPVIRKEVPEIIRKTPEEKPPCGEVEIDQQDRPERETPEHDEDKERGVAIIRLSGK